MKIKLNYFLKRLFDRLMCYIMRIIYNQFNKYLITNYVMRSNSLIHISQARRKELFSKIKNMYLPELLDISKTSNKFGLKFKSIKLIRLELS